MHSSTRLINLIPDPEYVSPSESSACSVAEVAILTTVETEGRRHMDVALDPIEWSRALVVDESGGLWLWYEIKVERQERLQKATKL